MHFSVDLLESRRLLSVALTSDGWTKLGKSSDTRVVYVSSSAGNDGNSGLSEGSAFKTIGKARTLIRDGKPDWLMLKRGDTFSGGIGPWKTSGRSSQEPQLIGNYGSGARPILKTGTKEGFVTFGGTGHAVDNVAVIGLDFVADTYNGKNGSFSTTGIRLTRQGTNWLIEDCRVRGYKDNIVLDGDGSGVSNFRLRRSQIIDAYVASSKVGNGKAQGLYLAAGTKNATIEENVFDHNGWKSKLSGAEPTMFNHNIYVYSGVSGTIIRNNIVTRASLCGIKALSAVTVQNNLITRSPVGIKASGGGTSISGNVILEGVDLAGTSGGATGIDVTALSGITISNNLIAHELSSAKYHVTGIRLNGGVKNATLSGNIIYNWQQAINNAGGSNITISGNQLTALNSNAPLMDQPSSANPGQHHYSNNLYSSPRSKVNRLNNVDVSFSSWVSATKETGAKLLTLKYLDPRRSFSPSFDAWINSAREQRHFKWNNDLTAAVVIKHIRGGFKV